MHLTGSCFCGAFTYELDASLQGAQSCHCSRCRKIFSGTGSAFGFLAQDSFRWRSEPTGLPSGLYLIEILWGNRNNPLSPGLSMAFERLLWVIS